MNGQSVVFSGTEAGDKPQISIMYVGMPEAMVKVLNEHAWQIMAKFHMLAGEMERAAQRGEPIRYDS